MAKKRNEFIDYLKGIAVFMVIWGHTLQGCTMNEIDIYENKIFQFIYSFHMPLFAILSGYLFFFSLEKKKFNEIVRSKIRKIGIPLAIWNTLLYFREIIFALLKKEEIVLGIHFYFLYFFKSLWFLWTILICNVVVSAVVKCKFKYMHLRLLLVSLLGCIFTNIIDDPLQNTVGTKTAFLLPIFIIGYELAFWREKITINDIKTRYKICICIIYIILLMFYTRESLVYVSGINPLNSKYGVVDQILIDVYRWVIGLIGVIVCIMISHKFYKMDILINLKNNIINIGKNSMQLYILQAFFLEKVISQIIKILCKVTGENILINNIFLYSTVITFIIAIVYTVILTRILKIIKNTPFITKIL